MRVLAAACLIAALALGGCGTGAPAAAGPSPTAAAGDCQVTAPGGTPPPPASEFARDPTSYGNGTLWVALPPDGAFQADANTMDPDGFLRLKLGWWRGIPGPMRIEGRRLDGPAGPARGDVPAGYEATGFQATSVSFPTTGCWEVTGVLGASRLTFVLRVTRAG